MMLLAMMLQSANSEPESSVKFPRYTEPAESCGKRAAAEDGEIVVCATRPDRYRIKALPEAVEYDLPKTERSLGNGTVVNVHTEQVDVGGQPSKRGMVTLKIGF